MCRAICSERGSIRANSAGGWGRRRRTGKKGEGSIERVRDRSRHTRRVTDDIILATPQRCPGSQAADRQPGSSRGRREAVTRLGSEGRADRSGAPLPHGQEPPPPDLSGPAGRAEGVVRRVAGAGEGGGPRGAGGHRSRRLRLGRSCSRSRAHHQPHLSRVLLDPVELLEHVPPG